MKKNHYIKDPVKPPFHSYPPPQPIPKLPKIDKLSAIKTFHNEEWSARTIENSYIEDLREILIELIESTSLPKDFDQVVFDNTVIEEADLTELIIPFKLHFQNCFFLSGLHLNHSSFPMLSVSGYISGNLSLTQIKGNPPISIANLQVDQIYIFDGDGINFGASTTTIGRLTISNCKVIEICLHDSVNILDGIWLDKLKVERGIIFWRCTVHTYFRIHNVECRGNIELEACHLHAL